LSEVVLLEGCRSEQVKAADEDGEGDKRSAWILHGPAVAMWQHGQHGQFGTVKSVFLRIAAAAACLSTEKTPAMAAEWLLVL
jgi:hypothetical protein